MIGLQATEIENLEEPKIYGVRIYQENDAYCIAVRHTGEFRLKDYDELDVEVKSARLTRRS